MSHMPKWQGLGSQLSPDGTAGDKQGYCVGRARLGQGCWEDHMLKQQGLSLMVRLAFGSSAKTRVRFFL